MISDKVLIFSLADGSYYMKILIITSLFFLFNNALAQNNSNNNQYVGYEVCASCHQDEVKQWQDSHHNKAMQHADHQTVLGNFNQKTFENYGLITTFYKKTVEEKIQYWVKTDGPDGKLQDYEIKYTFGVYPLQQYLIEFPGGRLQALDIAWDSRTKDQGGQRWYHLHPDEKITSDDVLHWTGPNMNWNYMCAFCHSTNLEKNYQLETDSYQTSWFEMNVSCEACHGPAEKHIQWAKLAATDIKKADKDFKQQGLNNVLNERKNIQWNIDATTKKPYRVQNKQSNHEIETCARCHSRRSQLSEDKIHQPFMNSFRPARLTSGLYYADGQPKDEVYVYGSFIQSKMYHAGVTCSDCHNPHSNELKLPGDQVCNQCHIAETYRSEKHHHHKVKGQQSDVSCIDCHMSATIYMGVDVRNDHSFRIPRPDLSDGTDIPNACNKCHTVNTAKWSAQRLKDWYKKSPVGMQQFAGALSAHQQQQVIAEKQLHDLIGDKNQPAIARATALGLLANYPDEQSLRLIKSQLKDTEPMMRLAGLEALSSFDKRSQVTLAFPLIYDDIISVRMEAGRLLASIPKGQLSNQDINQLKKVEQEYLNAQLFNAERPESQVNLANYYFELKKFKQSEMAFQQAIKLQNQFIPAYIGLAQLLSQTGRENEANSILKKGLSINPNNSDLHHSLGLSYIRQKNTEMALEQLQIAASHAEENTRYQYVYAVALNTVGQTENALMVLNHVLENNPQNIEILIALLSFNRDSGNYPAALNYAKKLKMIMPDNVDIQNLIHELSNKK